MEKDESKRIGSKNSDEVKSHPWFQSINWKDLNNFKIDPPIKPNILDKWDTQNFNKDIQKEGFLRSG